MAAKSISVPSPLGAVLRVLREYAANERMGIEEAPLQNGLRVRLLATPAIGLNVYPSKAGGCKVVFDRPESAASDLIVSALGGEASASRPRTRTLQPLAPVVDDANGWVGSDESGKGDYFGPLVTAAVALTHANWEVVDELGVQDSKRLSDTRVTALAREIRPAFPNEVVVVMPARYNELWQKFGNVNRLLAWAHARAIENVLTNVPDATVAVADQFGDESLIREALFRRGKEVRLVQMPRAERDPAVAAASVLARAEFIRRLNQLSREAGVTLPKGASSQVETAARALVSRLGRDALGKFAKEHFRTTARVVNPRVV